MSADPLFALIVLYETCATAAVLILTAHLFGNRKGTH